MKKAYFACGCFWCITPVFEENGVTRVTCGFCGGTEADPDYDSVKAQLTSHRETVELEYDESRVSFADLCDVFLANVDPTDGGGQFIDRGRSYTLAVYYASESERAVAAKRIAEWEKANGEKAYIALEPLGRFYPAEEEHQDYYKKEPESFAREMRESGREERFANR
ncbi:MAG: peptide-methionine (S)-S-oxide reductase MsrA [Clostridia bacterium]|nr:peptide-methionine (S)-S-oxide reductase MsrA [Clostridia bacterium]